MLFRCRCYVNTLSGLYPSKFTDMDALSRFLSRLYEADRRTTTREHEIGLLQKSQRSFLAGTRTGKGTSEAHVG